MLSVAFFNCYTECRYAEYRYAECHFGKCHSTINGYTLVGSKTCQIF
jgi:hypothetical protein